MTTHTREIEYKRIKFNFLKMLPYFIIVNTNFHFKNLVQCFPFIYLKGLRLLTLRIDPISFTWRRIWYFRLQCAYINIHWIFMEQLIYKYTFTLGFLCWPWFKLLTVQANWGPLPFFEKLRLLPIWVLLLHI